MNCKFKPGDRVVNTLFSSNHNGVGGTVIRVTWVEKEFAITNVARGYWLFDIVLDTAERLLVKQTVHWEHEQAYIDGSYIPF